MDAMASTIEERLSERAPTALAWQRYLEETRFATNKAYELIEALAWRRLQAELTRLARPLPPRADRGHLFHSRLR